MSDDGMEMEGGLSGGVMADDLEERQDDVRANGGPAMRAEHAAALEMLDARAMARQMVLPTDDSRVRHKLRSLAEPVTLFGERPPDRRERLREVLVSRQREGRSAGDGGEAVVSEDEDDVQSDEDGQEEEFFTEGSEDLLETRRSIAIFSLRRAARRIAHQKQQVSIPLQRIVQTRKEIYTPLRSFTNLGSQIGDTRPISIVRFSPDGKLLGTGSWSGGVRLWDVPSARARQILRGHNDKVGGLSWHPQATLTQTPSSLNLATGAADGNVMLWNLTQDRPLTTLAGHAARVARIEFHPSGRYVASASFDGTWRLWDAEKGMELLVQEGHSKEVYAVSFQEDGALLASGGLDAIGRLWDLRTGRTAMILDGHAREILSIDFSSNGFTLATASGDDTVKVWDLRQLKQTYSIPAHKSSCADVRFFKSGAEKPGLQSGSDVTDTGTKEGRGNDEAEEALRQSSEKTSNADSAVSLPRSSTFLATAGYDGYVKIWSADDWQILRAMHADSKAMSVDVHPQGDMLASGEWGRTFKLWGSL